MHIFQTETKKNEKNELRRLETLNSSNVVYMYSYFFIFMVLYESEVRIFDLVFMRGAGYPGNPCYGGHARLGNQQHAEKLSPRIVLHLSKVRK